MHVVSHSDFLINVTNGRGEYIAKPKHEVCAQQHGAYMQHATCTMQHTTQRTPCSAACGMQLAPCSLQRATCNMQHAPWNLESECNSVCICLFVCLSVCLFVCLFLFARWLRAALAWAQRLLMMSRTPYVAGCLSFVARRLLRVAIACCCMRTLCEILRPTRRPTAPYGWPRQIAAPQELLLISSEILKSLEMNGKEPLVPLTEARARLAFALRTHPSVGRSGLFQGNLCGFRGFLGIRTGGANRHRW